MSVVPVLRFVIRDLMKLHSSNNAFPSLVVYSLFFFLLYCELDLHNLRQHDTTTAKLDSVKTYMRIRRVPEHLKIKVIKWFDYLWMTQKSSDEEKSVGFLPGTACLPHVVVILCFSHDSEHDVLLWDLLASLKNAVI